MRGAMCIDGGVILRTMLFGEGSYICRDDFLTVGL